MKLLVVCDQGNNRSVTLAHQLKYLGHDVLSAGLSTNSQETLYFLYKWADKVIFTEGGQLDMDALKAGLNSVYRSPTTRHFIDKFTLWDIGPDVYPRPFNKDLLKIVKTLIAQHRDELNNKN